MKIARLLSQLAFAFAFVAPATFAQTSLKLGIPNTLASHFGVAATTFVDEVKKTSAGKFNIEIFPSGALGGEREMVEGAQIGAVDLVIVSSGPVGNFVPETFVFDIPFLFRDYDHARNVLDGPIGQEILAKFPAKGLVALAWGENGFRHLTNNKRAITTPDDLKGLKLRTMENPVHLTAFRTFGALPTPMSFPELFTALQQGTVDGQENPIPVIVASKFGQVQKYLTMTGHIYSPALFIASPQFFNALSAADKKVFSDAARKAAVAMRKRVNEMEAGGVNDLRAQGVAVVAEVDKARFQAALAPAYAEYAKKFGAGILDRVKNAR